LLPTASGWASGLNKRKTISGLKICEASSTQADLMTTENISDSEIPPAKARRALSSDDYFLCGPFDVAQDMLASLRLGSGHALREIF
jgi:hypothetical protein